MSACLGSRGSLGAGDGLWLAPRQPRRTTPICPGARPVLRRPPRHTTIAPLTAAEPASVVRDCPERVIEVRHCPESRGTGARPSGQAQGTAPNCPEPGLSRGCLTPLGAQPRPSGHGSGAADHLSGRAGGGLPGRRVTATPSAAALPHLHPHPHHLQRHAAIARLSIGHGSIHRSTAPIGPGTRSDHANRP